jgi:hypothetical protein
VIVLAIRRSSGEMVFNPPPDARVQSGDHLIAMGETGRLRKLEQMLYRSRCVKVLTGEQMREVDRATIEAGTPECLDERAGRRVAAIIKREFHP